MPLSVLIFHFDPARLRILCAIAFCTGLTALFFGLRRSGQVSNVSENSDQPKPDSSSDSAAPHASAEPAGSMPQVIRLSLPSVAARSTEMSQQQKVAAALLKAGIAHPASWADSSPHVDRATPAARSESSSAIPEPAIVPPTHYIKSPAPKLNTPSPALGPKFLVIGGALLALASLFLFLRIH